MNSKYVRKNMSEKVKNWYITKNYELSKIENFYSKEEIRDILLKDSLYKKFSGKCSNRILMNYDLKLYKSILEYTKELNQQENKNYRNLTSRINFIVEANYNIELLKCQTCKTFINRIDCFCRKCNLKYPSKKWFISKYGDNWKFEYKNNFENIKKSKTRSRSSINYILNVGQNKSRIGKHETQILDEQEKLNNCKIQRSFPLYDLGYIVDGYDKENNIVYEVYEKRHEKQIEKDLERENEIRKKLNCNFIVIWDR